MKRKLLFIMLLFMPVIVLATNGDEEMPLAFALGMEAFVSIHMSVFFLYPMSSMLAKEGNAKQLFIKLFVIRVILLLYCDFFVTPFISLVDFVSVFIGAFVIVPITAFITKKDPFGFSTPAIQIPETEEEETRIEKICLYCKTKANADTDVCPNCGARLSTKVIKTVTRNLSRVEIIGSNEIKYKSERILDAKKELENNGIFSDDKRIPRDILKKNNIKRTIKAVLLGLFICSIFMRINIFYKMLGLMILIISTILLKEETLKSYITANIYDKRPIDLSQEIHELKNSLVEDSGRRYRRIITLLAIVLPLIMFMNPRISYREVNGGYAVDYYTYGLSNLTQVTIPEEHNGKKVVEIGDNAFNGMHLIRTVNLPNTIEKIGDNAFEDTYSLNKINLPNSIKSIGKEAFKNSGLERLTLPAALEEVGSYAFAYNSNLTMVEIPGNLKVISRGMFMDCYNLKTVGIPDTVLYIDEYAFSGCTTLVEVGLTRTSNLIEIKNYAFESCYNLLSITITRNTKINDYSFFSNTHVNFFEPENSKPVKKPTTNKVKYENEDLSKYDGINNYKVYVGFDVVMRVEDEKYERLYYNGYYDGYYHIVYENEIEGIKKELNYQKLNQQLFLKQDVLGVLVGTSDDSVTIKIYTK